MREPAGASRPSRASPRRAASLRAIGRALAPWLALVVFLAVPPFVWPQSWLLAYLAQSATMIVFALSYNLLLGETGLLSFGHAAYAGLGALVAAQVFNRIGVPLMLLPLLGGIGGALCGVPFGFIATRRAGTAFAMITLGLGELVVAAAWALPDWFGGVAGVAIDRTRAPLVGNWSFGPAREAYALIALWCLLASMAMFALSRTPFMRLANAVRDNPARAAAIGCYPRRIRYGVVVLSAFFAGIAGTLGLINLELVSTESIGMMRSGAVLIATVIGGTAAFFGPVAGALVMTFFSVVVASVTRAWLFYLGLFFIVVVVVSPDGLAGFAGRHTARVATHGWRRCRAAYLWATAAALLWTATVVLAVQWAYAAQFGTNDGAAFNLAGVPWSSAASPLWLGVALFVLGASGALATHCAVRAQARLAGRARASQSTGDAR
ncbi:ABC-type branched-chain amino acid transport system, permease component [Paraburkholderia ribeironis]|uniref:ABC-type branched-chain amino acid transport system, permease component n=1 Tax=Paraburkholderia ribeironis TaxID=1247936 RepID=A0A1N7SBR7_9BURK|nr:branched-chain amino acid ABC transporter permease [Paraburkholderia ribeironis]SIT44773.1 ABC-type branched-chain amino acid transport system, permease component [Paraburkholderia ribeironis]